MHGVTVFSSFAWLTTKQSVEYLHITSHGLRSRMGSNITSDTRLCWPVDTCCMNPDQLEWGISIWRITQPDDPIRASLTAINIWRGFYNLGLRSFTTINDNPLIGLMSEGSYSLTGRLRDLTPAFAFIRLMRVIAILRISGSLRSILAETAVTPSRGRNHVQAKMSHCGQHCRQPTE